MSAGKLLIANRSHVPAALNCTIDYRYTTWPHFNTRSPAFEKSVFFENKPNVKSRRRERTPN